MKEYRLAIEIDSGKCVMCGGCVEVCPGQCFILTPDGAEIDQDECSACGQCLDMCEGGALKQSDI